VRKRTESSPPVLEDGVGNGVSNLQAYYQDRSRIYGTDWRSIYL
jgi:hypothetical protein